jgi:Protein of unknown function (DUF551)
MEWISIKDKFPEDDETVIGINHNSWGLTSPIVVYFEKDEKEFFSVYDSHSIPIKITHWCRTPEFKDSL